MIKVAVWQFTFHGLVSYFYSPVVGVFFVFDIINGVFNIVFEGGIFEEVTQQQGVFVRADVVEFFFGPGVDNRQFDYGCVRTVVVNKHYHLFVWHEVVAVICGIMGRSLFAIIVAAACFRVVMLTVSAFDPFHMEFCQLVVYGILFRNVQPFDDFENGEFVFVRTGR